jgi:hypothetical protein
MRGEFRLRRLEDGERRCGATEVEQATAVGRGMLIVAGAGAEKIAELVVASAEALGGAEALEPAHTSCAPLYAPMVLLKPITGLPRDWGCEAERSTFRPAFPLR